MNAFLKNSYDSYLIEFYSYFAQGKEPLIFSEIKSLMIIIEIIIKYCIIT